MKYVPARLAQQLQAVGLIFDGCDETGEIQWGRVPARSDLDAASLVLRAYDPNAKTMEELELDLLRSKIKNRTASVVDLMQYIELRGL